MDERDEVARRLDEVVGTRYHEARSFSEHIRLIFIAIGEIVLDGLHVELLSFRVAGGLLLLLISFRTVLNTQTVHPLAQTEAGEKADVAVFPLATPFLAGPGAIIAAVLLTENGRFSFLEATVTSLIAVGLCVFTFVVLASSDFLQRRLGATGTSVMS